jgi:DNA polymerase-4
MDKEISRKIIHVDMDAFYASVEQRDNALLRGKPVIVGGKPNGRGVVAACSYEARKYGVHSAMPSAEAGRRCPEAIFVKPRFEDYKAASKQIHEVFRRYTALIEPLSLDEAYLDVSANSRFQGSAVLLAGDIKREIFRQTRLVASAGVSYNKFLAKIASDFDKPDGLYCITPEQGEQFVAQLPVGRFHGVGKVTEARMHDLGIRTGADLKAWSLAELEREFGKSAQYYFKACRAIDEREVSVSRKRRSIGSERTFAQNLLEKSAMLNVLFALGDELLTSLAERQLAAATVSVKVRFADFETLSRAYTHASGTINKSCFDRVLPYLLDRALEARAEKSRAAAHSARSGVRLLGVTFSTLNSGEDSLPEQLEMDL